MHKILFFFSTVAKHMQRNEEKKITSVWYAINVRVSIRVVVVVVALLILH